MGCTSGRGYDRQPNVDWTLGESNLARTSCILSWGQCREPHRAAEQRRPRDLLQQRAVAPEMIGCVTTDDFVSRLICWLCPRRNSAIRSVVKGSQCVTASVIFTFMVLEPSRNFLASANSKMWLVDYHEINDGFACCPFPRW